MIEYRILTIRQPWASLIVWGVKPIENRSWVTKHRGAMLIHAGQKYERRPELEKHYNIDRAKLEYGAIIGIVNLVDIVEQHHSPFFVGPYGWVLDNPRGIDPIPMNGQQGLFRKCLDLTRRRIESYA